jgi:DeoR/GlpR family transcriptional regulator of sugar metabolism
MPPDQPLPTSVRRARILERIQRLGGASLAELAAEHAVSTITVHRDLEQLSREGLVVRFHGGARAAGAPAESRPETAWDRRLREAPEAKDAIAARARELIHNGDTVFLDASSTVFALAHRIGEEPAEDLTIVTTSPAVALGLDTGTARVIIAPGEVDLRMRAIADGWTVEFLRRIKLDVAFVSGSGFDLEHGLTTGRRQLADTVAAVRESADRVVALIDGSKLGRSAMVSILPAAQLDAVLIDDGADADTVAAYRAAGVNVEIA